MKASNISLVFTAELALGITGAFATGFIRGLTGSAELGGLLLFPAVLAIARLAGLWVSRREAPPSVQELLVGSVLYAGFCVLVAIGVRQPAATLVALAYGIGVAISFCRSTISGKRALQMNPRRSADP